MPPLAAGTELTICRGNSSIDFLISAGAKYRSGETASPARLEEPNRKASHEECRVEGKWIMLFGKLGGTIAAVGILTGLAAAQGQARELVYGILAPMTHPAISTGVQPLFEKLAKETSGGLNWRSFPTGSC